MSKPGPKPRPRYRLEILAAEYGHKRPMVLIKHLGGMEHLEGMPEESVRVLFSTVRWEKAQRGKGPRKLKPDHSGVRRVLPSLRASKEAITLMNSLAERERVRRMMAASALIARRVA